MKINELEEEKNALEMVIETDLRQDEYIFNKLKAENDNLRSDIRSFLKCSNCGKQFDEKSLLQTHMNKNHKIPEFKCFQCNDSFENELSLEKHMMSLHPVKMFTCKVCGHIFESKADMKMHMKKTYAKNTLRDSLLKKQNEMI